MVFSRLVKSPPGPLNAVFEVFARGPSAIDAVRRRELLRWEKPVVEFEDRGREMFFRAPTEVKACWSGT